MAFNLNILFESEVTNHAILYFDKLFLSEITNHVVFYLIISFSLRQVTNQFSSDLSRQAVRGDKLCIILPTEFFIAKISNYTVLCLKNLLLYEGGNESCRYVHAELGHF